MKDLFVQTVGSREAELGLSLGKLYTPSEALSVNLVDEILKCDEVMPRAIEEAEKWGNIPEMGRVATKRQLRGALLGDLNKNRESDVKWFADFILDPAIQRGIQAYLANLSKRSGSKQPK